MHVYGVYLFLTKPLWSLILNVNVLWFS